MNGGADFYATTVEGLNDEGRKSLKVFFEMCAEDGVEPDVRTGKAGEGTEQKRDLHFCKSLRIVWLRG